MNEFFTPINEVFSAAGFTVLTEISPSLMFRYGGSRYAVPKFKKTEVSKRVCGSGEYIGQELRVTAAVRCIGKCCKFSDAEDLEARVKLAERSFMFGRSENIRWLSTGEVIRDTGLGRLTVTVMLDMVMYDDREADADDDDEEEEEE